MNSARASSLLRFLSKRLSLTPLELVELRDGLDAHLRALVGIAAPTCAPSLTDSADRVGVPQAVPGRSVTIPRSKDAVRDMGPFLRVSSCAFAILAGCAQGSSDTGASADVPAEADAANDGDAGATGIVEAGVGVEPPPEDAGVADASSESQDARTTNGATDEAGSDAGADSGTHPVGGADASIEAGEGVDASRDGSAAVDSSSPIDSSAEPDAGDSGVGAVAPTTCAQADEKVGCCVGNDLYYCKGTTSVTSKTCAGGDVCGWLPSEGYYDCVAPPGNADPSGTHSIVCP
jgi:hypothetical protein